ncbi:MAG: hypothetical protein ACJ75H_21245 [Thermoanaerobaculia bacterium]
MNRSRVLWHLTRADFLERVRRYGFLVTLALAMFLGYGVSVGKIKLWVDNSRGIYNSAWVGTLMALVCNTFLALAGFYVVKGSVERDRQTGVGQILATTPMSKALYALGKTASNLAVLLAMAGVLAVMAVAAQLIAGESARIDVVELLMPMAVFCVPVLAITAALAVLFETLPGLRGGFGNVVWFFSWVTLLSMGAMGSRAGGTWDLFGLGLISESLFKVTAAKFGANGRNFVLGGITQEGKSRTFLWDGMDWTPGLLLSRLAWLGVAVGVALLAARFFDRFDPSRGWQRKSKARKAARNVAEAAEPIASAPMPTHLQPLPAGARRFRFFGLLRAELRLALQGQRWWWYAGAGGLLLAGFAAPLDSARAIVLPLSWIWPMLLWSSLGNREARFGTDGLVFAGPRPLLRQLPALWLSGVVLALLTGGAIGLRLALAGDGPGFGAWIVGALFIPTLALALGVWTGGSKAFEAVYLALWYIGPMQRTVPLDFLGALPDATRAGVPLGWLAATAVLGALAVLGRKRQLLAA